MNKSELVAAVAAKAGMSKVAAADAVAAVFAAITDALAKGEPVQLIGFGSFIVKENPAHEGVNPATGEKIQIAAKKVAKFKAGAALNAAL
jgi:DNA-binding protein HU-beta